VPYDAWLRTDFSSEIGSLLLSDRAADRGWFERGAIKGLLNGHFDGTANNGRQIWSLWNLELWARACLDGERPLMPSMEELDTADAREPALAG
jgi:hypothetical protein